VNNSPRAAARARRRGGKCRALMVVGAIVGLVHGAGCEKRAEVSPRPAPAPARAAPAVPESDRAETVKPRAKGERTDAGIVPAVPADPARTAAKKIEPKRVEPLPAAPPATGGAEGNVSLGQQVLEGTLKGNLAAIGGETTGWALVFDGPEGAPSQRILELDIELVRAEAEKLRDEKVRVSGEVVEVRRVERGTVRIMRVQKIEQWKNIEERTSRSDGGRKGPGFAAIEGVERKQVPAPVGRSTSAAAVGSTMKGSAEVGGHG